MIATWLAVLATLVAAIVGFYLGAAFVAVTVVRRSRPAPLVKGRLTVAGRRCEDCGEVVCNADCPGIPF